MTESALAKKMKLKEGCTATILNAPDDYLEELKPFPLRAKILQKPDTQSDWIQIFVKTKTEIDALFPKILWLLKPNTLIWICFPKATSKIQTDLTRDKGWDVVAEANLKWVALISINATWSAFAVRPYKPGEAKQSIRSKP
ncbi:MAG: hypothetical protein IT310_11500 [Anaerolineales bacterium]|nr:hypothetical protein [Anaerolineales bacterium]